MEKTVFIDGKEIKMKATAMLPLRYRAAFGKDIFKVQGSIFGLAAGAGVNMKAIEDIDCVGIMEVMWCMAKEADASIPDFEKWLETFDTFPIFDVFNEVFDLFMVNVTSTTKIKNINAAGSSQHKG